jgi:hypothetical protein
MGETDDRGRGTLGMAMNPMFSFKECLEANGRRKYGVSSANTGSNHFLAARTCLMRVVTEIEETPAVRLYMVQTHGRGDFASSSRSACKV